MTKKNAPRSGGKVRDALSAAARQSRKRASPNTLPGKVQDPLELPEFASLAPMRSRLIPLCRPVGTGCSCPHHKHDPKSNGKAPIESAWQRIARVSHWPSYPFNVGVRLGSRLAVLDRDDRNGGRESLASLEARYGPLPPGPRVSTGGGGYHYYFAAPADQAPFTIAPGLEIKAQGSQVVAPGSLHNSGKKYEWEVDPTQAGGLPELPSWLRSKAHLKAVPDDGEDPRKEAWHGNTLHWRKEEFTIEELAKRARLYLRSMPVEREAGHSWAFRLANVLVRGFLLRGQDALFLFEEYNREYVKPPWSKGELLHKLDSAAKDSRTFQWGYLLKGDREKFDVEVEPSDDQGAEAEGEEGPSDEPPGEVTGEDDGEPGSEDGDEGSGTRVRKEDERIVFVISLNKFFSFPEGVYAPPKPRDQGLVGLELSAAVGALQAQGMGFRNATLICKQKRCVIVEDIRRWPSNERILTHDGKRYLNPFWQLIPEPERGECPNLDTLVRAIGGDDQGAEWLWNWAAYVVQNPNVLPGVCVVARGGFGLGKSKLGEAIGLCRGVYATCTNSAFHSEFNSRWADARFINAAEVMLADSKQEDNQRFLSLITDPSIEYHKKNQNAYEIPNRIAWWLTSNLDNPVIVKAGDRRFTILDSQIPPPENLEVLKRAWTTFEGRYSDWPELRAFRWKLLHHPVDIAAARRPLLNEARKEVQDASRSSSEDFCDELSGNGWLPLAYRYTHLMGVSTTEGAPDDRHIYVDPQYLHRIYVAWCKDAGMGVTGYVRFSMSGAMKRFPKSPQRKIKGVLYRLRLVPLGQNPE